MGRNAAVADLGRLKFAGFPAWLAWIFIHIWFLIEFDNKLLVLFQWAWNYFTRKQGARLISGDEPFPLVSADSTGSSRHWSRQTEFLSRNGNGKWVPTEEILEEMVRFNCRSHPARVKRG